MNEQAQIASLSSDGRVWNASPGKCLHSIPAVEFQTSNCVIMSVGIKDISRLKQFPTPPRASRYLSAGAFLRLGVYKSWSGRAVSHDDTHHKHCWPLAIAVHFFICSSPPHTSAEGAGRIPHQRGITLLADRKQLYNLLYKALSGIDVSLAIKEKKN